MSEETKKALKRRLGGLEELRDSPDFREMTRRALNRGEISLKGLIESVRADLDAIQSQESK